MCNIIECIAGCFKPILDKFVSEPEHNGNKANRVAVNVLFDQLKVPTEEEMTKKCEALDKKIKQELQELNRKEEDGEWVWIKDVNSSDSSIEEIEAGSDEENDLYE